jgi:hypothetical protein
MQHKRAGKEVTVTNFVDSLLFLARKIAPLIDSTFLEKVANFIARRKEVVIADVVVVAGDEFGLWL